MGRKFKGPVYTLQVEIENPFPLMARGGDSQFFRQQIQTAIRSYFYENYSVSLKLKVADPRRIRAGKRSWITRRKNNRG